MIQNKSFEQVIQVGNIVAFLNFYFYFHTNMKVIYFIILMLNCFTKQFYREATG